MTNPRRRRTTRTDTTVRAIAYVRVSTDEQVGTGNGLDAQRAALTDRAAREGWDLEIVADEGISGATVTKRPALLDALARLDAGDADVLVASKVDRLSRSVVDFAGVLKRAEANGWRVVLLDLGDLSGPAGQMTAHVISAAAEYERSMISVRTRDALAARKARGERHGMPSALAPEVLRRIVDEHRDGRTLRAIAQGLMDDGITTATGKETWHASTVRAVLNSQDAAALQ